MEFGSLDINGNVNALLGQAQYSGLDLAPGPNVTDVMDCRDWDSPVDIVLCLELLEHNKDLQGILNSIVRNTTELAIVTCATDPRLPHSAIDGGDLREGEYYGNITKTRFVNAVKKPEEKSNTSKLIKPRATCEQ